jgi:hypothetical protein
MNEEERLKLRRLVASWSDGRGLAQATTLADQHRYLLPKRITNAQLSGLNGVVQAAANLEQVTAFTQHQGERAARAGRLDVKGYWDALRQALEALEREAEDLATQAGLTLAPPPGKGKARSKAPEWLTLWLAQEFVQHLVAHSLYLSTIGSLA